MTSTSLPAGTLRRAAARETLRGPDGRRIRVLVVDDEPTLAELVGMALRYEGWEVLAVNDGVTAVAAARDFSPDLIVLDVMLPDMAGFEVLRKVRADATGGAAVPVLFLTAWDAVEDRIAGLSAGGDDHVAKPFSTEELVLRLRGLLRGTNVAAAVDSSVITVGDLRLDEDSLAVHRGEDLIG